MNEIADNLVKYKIVLKSLKEFDKTLLGTRKKLKIYSGTDRNGFYNVIFYIDQKSRFLQKNAQEIMELEERLEQIVNHRYRYKYLFIKSPICSKAKKLLQDNGWRVKNDTV